MKSTITIVTICLSVFYWNKVAASEHTEMNIRQTIDNSSMNKIVGARLRGLLAGETAQRGVSEAGASESDCSTNIGNTVGQTPLTGSVQDIIIVGDIINFCQ